MIRQLFAKLVGTEPKYEWVQKNGIYRLEIKNYRSRMNVEYHPDNKATIKPIIEEQRKTMWFPSCKGPLEQTSSDGWFMIENDWPDGYLPAYQAYFLNGEFKYGSGHHPGFGDIRSIAEDFHDLDDFKEEVQKHFCFKKYDQFTAFFIKSNLPETHRHAVKSLLE